MLVAGFEELLLKRRRDESVGPMFRWQLRPSITPGQRRDSITLFAFSVAMAAHDRKAFRLGHLIPS
jgi:hypothetical protein